jgi:phosphohistidine phosphatase SixA
MALVAGALWAVAFAPSAVAQVAWQDALQHPGVHVIMRHALAPGTGDPTGFQVDECATQRNLDDQGRAQARAIGAALQQTGVAFDRVLSSQWCRCLETAELLDLGEVEPLPALNSFFEDRSTADAQTDELEQFLAELPAGQRVMLVTHQVNITALTGRAVGSGEFFLIESTPGGGVRVLEEVWIRP